MPNNYMALDKVLLRAAHQPLERYRLLADTVAPSPKEQLALLVASESIVKAVARENSSVAKSAKTTNRLLKYLIRMSTRPTPFGLFSGVGLADLGSSFALGLAHADFNSHIRCDMEGIYSLVWALESLPEVFRELSVCRSSAGRIRGNLLYLAGIDSSPSPAASEVSEIEVTPAVLELWELTGTAIALRDLTTHLLRRGSSADKAEAFVKHFWRTGFLVTDLRPPMTGSDPLLYIIDRLSSIPFAMEMRRRLVELRALLTDWAEHPTAQNAENYRNILEKARYLTGGKATRILQIDACLNVCPSTISKSIAKDAARAAELLLSLTPWPSGPPSLKKYTDDFIERYGTHRPVAILELIDPEVGLGPPSGNAPFEHRPSQRDDLLSRLAVEATKFGIREVQLDADVLATLRRYRFDPASAPASMDIYIQLCGKSLANINAGDYRLVVGPNIGSYGAGKTVARFSHLLSEVEPLLLEIDASERSILGDIKIVELVYRPTHSAGDNVVVRPNVRSYETGVNVTASTRGRTVIPLEEVVVYFDNGHLKTRWTKDGMDHGEIMVSSGHMLNSAGAAPICRLLEDLSRAGRASPSEFDWGTAKNFPYLPRVSVGRIVLRLAQWRLFEDDVSAWKRTDVNIGFDEWSRRWDLPRYLYVRGERDAPDNRLLLDLHSDIHRPLFREMMVALRAGDSLILQEALPGPDDQWLRSPSGHHMAEMVFSLIQKKTDGVPIIRRVPSLVKVDEISRHFPPGTEWLTFNLYVGASVEDSLIVDQLRPWSSELLLTGAIEKWMFVRYSDLRSHIRFRVHVDVEATVQALIPGALRRANKLVANGIIQDFSLESYEREIERYGGCNGMKIAEQFHYASSKFVVEFLGNAQEQELNLDRLNFCALSVDMIMRDLGRLSSLDRVAWAEGLSGQRREFAVQYRDLRHALLPLFRRTSVPPYVATTFDQFARELGVLGTALWQLEENGQLTQTVPDITGTCVHLHCNRLLGRDPYMERKALSLLASVYFELSRSGNLGTLN